MLKRCLLAFCASLVIVLGSAQNVNAQFHTQNNVVGVHQISPSEQDIRDGCRLVNANGGAWGWQTIVIREGEYTPEGLQKLHDIAREEKCILIHRIASRFADGGNWAELTDSTIQYAANLFSKVNTSTKYKYVIWGNEVNHGSEYGGACNPTAYGESATAAAKALKEADPNIVFMLAGLDLAAPESRPQFCDAVNFYREMLTNVPQVVDGWDALASHCYPMNFVGSAATSGRRSIMCGEWEKGLLQSLGVQKAANFKIFITETGWKHGAGGISAAEVADNLRLATARWQQNPDIMAVTYFAFKFLTPPFNVFALVDGENSGNEIASVMRGAFKTEGEPEQTYKSSCVGTFPKDLVENVPYDIELECVNKGTDIWEGIEGNYKLVLQSPFEYECTNFHTVKPGGTLRTTCTINPGKTSGCPTLNVAMTRKDSLLMRMMATEMCVNPPAQLKLNNIRRFPGTVIGSGDLEVQVIKERTEQFVSRMNVTIQDGTAVVPAV